MSRIATAVLLLTIGAEMPAIGQAGRPAFDAASVKATDGAGDFVDVKGATVTAHAARIATCIAWAYDLPANQVIAANSTDSAMLRDLRYDIVAKAEGRVPIDRLRAMFQTLLADRFKVTAHRQPREMQGYALAVDKNGPKFKESQGDGDASQRLASKLTRQWTHTTMTEFASQLSEAMQAPVVDETALPATYDLSLDLTPYLQTNSGARDVGAMMVTALPEQLGLKLVGRRSRVDILVVDHVEKPSPD